MIELVGTPIYSLAFDLETSEQRWGNCTQHRRVLVPGSRLLIKPLCYTHRQLQAIDGNGMPCPMQPAAV